MISPGELLTHPERARLRAKMLALLDRVEAAPDRAIEEERDALLAEIASFQAAHVVPFARLAAARGARFDRGPDGWPALPTDVFRHARVSSFEEGADARVFQTSGTTHGARGRHPFLELSLYERAAMLGARHAFLPTEPFDMLVLAADPARQPDSSLAHMIGLFAAEAAARTIEARVAFALDGDRIDVAVVERAVDEATASGRALVVCGTAFAFVFAEDVLARRAVLPSGSRAMFTGGFKGRSRVLDELELRRAISERFGVPGDHVVAEYGMTELSSQLWSRERIASARGARAGLFWIPPWMRVTPVDPATLEPVREGEPGLLRFDDAANLDSCVSIQTADVGVLVREPDRAPALRLLGRDPSAVPRGCSIAIEEALSRGSSP